MDEGSGDFSERDFDFWMGSVGAAQPASQVARRLRRVDRVRIDERGLAPILDGLGNADELRTRLRRRGSSRHVVPLLRPRDAPWSIYWADSRRTGLLDPPVVGSFSAGVGVFEGRGRVQRQDPRPLYVVADRHRDAALGRAFSPDEQDLGDELDHGRDTRPAKPAMSRGCRGQIG